MFCFVAFEGTDVQCAEFSFHSTELAIKSE
jgi:hypothetical protein